MSDPQKNNLIKIYDGNIGMVKAVLENPKRYDILQKAISAQGCIKSGNSYELAKLLYAFNKKKDEFLLFLKDMEYICAADISQDSIKVINAVTETKKAMERNVNLALAMQNFIIAVKK